MAQRYRIETQQYNEAFADLESNCNELTFVNKGQAVYLNGVKMDNGDAIMIGGNAAGNIVPQNLHVYHQHPVILKCM